MNGMEIKVLPAGGSGLTAHWCAITPNATRKKNAHTPTHSTGLDLDRVHNGITVTDLVNGYRNTGFPECFIYLFILNFFYLSRYFRLFVALLLLESFDFCPLLVGILIINILL